MQAREQAGLAQGRGWQDGLSTPVRENLSPSYTLEPKNTPTVKTNPSPATSRNDAEEETMEDMYKHAPPPPVLVAKPTEGAIFKRLWRVMRPREDGTFLVAESIRDDYKNLDTRANVVHIFEQCAYDVSC